MLIKPYPKVENIFAIAIPLSEPPNLITANVYTVGKGPITLIDTGPKIPGSLEFIKKRLQTAGFDFNDIERIIFTHGHVDHFGLAVSICEAVGHPVECFIHAEDKWQVSSEGFQDHMFGKEAERFMAMVDMPRKEMEKIKERFSSFKELADPIEDVSTIEDGAEFTGEGYHLRVIHTPGHSPGSSCLYETNQKILFSGDHIIKHITPNPLIAIKRNHLRDPHYQSLKAYMNSLDKLSYLDVRFGFSGHGEYIDDLQGIISVYRIHHQERSDLVWNALKEKSRPIYHLIKDVFPFMPKDDVFLAISEILVHLEILINEDRVKLVDPGPPELYRAL